MSKFHGRCSCGAVTFTLTAPTKWCSHCHCTMCQRAHGAAVVTWVGVDTTQVKIDERYLFWYESSSDSQRGFCQQCGSTLFFRSERWPGELHVVRANIVGDIDRQPAVHAYFDTHVSWLSFNDELPRRDASVYAADSS